MPAPLGGISDHGKEMAPLGAPSASSAFFCRLPRRRSGEPMPPPVVGVQASQPPRVRPAPSPVIGAEATRLQRGTSVLPVIS